MVLGNWSREAVQAELDSICSKSVVSKSGFLIRPWSSEKIDLSWQVNSEEDSVQATNGTAETFSKVSAREVL